jgi:SPP1 family predicted phage head-tail adaptor
MAKCKIIRTNKRKICLGDLDKRIILQNRNIAAPVYGSVNFDENFTTIATVWAGINTVGGKTFFDGVSDRVITHEIFIRYDATVTASTWIEFENRRIDILNVEDWEERHEYMKLICNERGANTLEATKI